MLVKIGDCYVDPRRVEGIYRRYQSGEGPASSVYIALRCGAILHCQCENLEAELVELGMLDGCVPICGMPVAPEMTDEERCELYKFAKQGFNWAAKDDSGFVRVHITRPAKAGAYWTDDTPAGRCFDGDYDWLSADGDPFFFGYLLDDFGKDL